MAEAMHQSPPPATTCGFCGYKDGGAFTVCPICKTDQIALLLEECTQDLRELNAALDPTYRALSEAMTRLERDPDFPSGMAVLNVKGALLGKKIV